MHGAVAALNHCPLLLSVVADSIGCGAGDILDFELQLADTQPYVPSASSAFSCLVRPLGRSLFRLLFRSLFRSFIHRCVRGCIL